MDTGTCGVCGNEIPAERNLCPQCEKLTVLGRSQPRPKQRLGDTNSQSNALMVIGCSALLTVIAGAFILNHFPGILAPIQGFLDYLRGLVG